MSGGGGLEITVAEERNAYTLVLSGELDISTSADVEAELARVEAKDPPLIVLDLRGLSFMDSTGLRLVLGADSRARKAGRRLAVVPGPEAVHRVFLIALLDKRLEFLRDPQIDRPAQDER